MAPEWTDPPKTVGDLIDMLQRLGRDVPIPSSKEHRMTGLPGHCQWVVGLWHTPPEDLFLAVVFADGSGTEPTSD